MALPQNRFNNWGDTSRFLYKSAKGGTWDSGAGPALQKAIERYDSGYALSPPDAQLLKDAGFRFDKGAGGGPGGGTTGSARTTPTGFDLNPKPTGGNGAYGLVPGPLGLPDPHGDLARVLPDLDALNSRTSASILDELGGRLSPETQAALNNLAAERGVSSGMPGAQTWDHLFLGNIAGAMENLKQQGITNYGQFIPTVSRTQTVDPALQAEIANTNAINAAAPDPAAAASEAERLFNQYKASIGAGGGGGGNPGGGTRGTTTAPASPFSAFIQPRTQPAPTNTNPGTFGGTSTTFQPNGTTPPPGTTPPGTVPNWLDATTPGGWDNWLNPGGGTTSTGGAGPTVGAPYGTDAWDEYNQWQF